MPFVKKVAPAAREVDAEQLPWNRGLRRRMLKARRIILHLYSGKDQKTWQAFQDADTVVVCLDKVINPKMDMLKDHVFLFLLQLAAQGRVHAILGVHRAELPLHVAMLMMVVLNL